MRSELSLRAVGVTILAMLALGSGVTATDVAPPSNPQLVTASLKGVPATEAVEYLTRASGLELVPLWSDADHPEGLDPERLIDMECRAATPMTALSTLLQRLDPAATWQRDESGAIEISTRRRLNERPTVQIYDIRDLLTDVPNYPNGATIDLEAALRRGAGSVLKEDPSETRLAMEKARNDRADRLVELITATVEPEQWVGNGGGAGTICAYQSTLIVRAPGYVQRQIIGALDSPAPVRRPGR